MKQQLTYYLAALAVLLGCLTSATTQAQVLKGTFAAGGLHSLAIHADGTLWATGDNRYGQLGIGSPLASSTWVQVGTGNTWVQVAAGYVHSLALRADGTLWAWGDNVYGELSSSVPLSSSRSPVQVGTARYAQVAAGTNYTLALQADGTVWAWGDNAYGQLGNNSVVGTATPQQVSMGAAVSLAAGNDFGLALRPDGSIWGWGRNNLGQLGNSLNGTTVLVPVQIMGGNYTQVSAGNNHGLALRVDGTLWAWGSNGYGQLGTGMGVASVPPTQLGTATYTSITAGTYNSLALRPDGTLWTWGNNYSGQLGIAAGANDPSNVVLVPTPLGTASQWVQVQAGLRHTLALRADGTLWTWGSNQYQQLGTSVNVGISTANPVPTATGTALPTRSTTGGSNFGLAIKGDGTLWAWGDNEYGQLGLGVAPGTLRPTQVGTDRDWVQVVAGSLHGVALKANGTTWAWGYNTDGQLGLGTTATQYTPALVNAPTLTRLAAGDFHTLGLLATGQLIAWGQNTSGQLGTGTALGTSLLVPTILTSGLQAASIAAGGSHSLALKVTGLLYVWGSNQYDQRGDGFAAIASTPVPGSSPGPLVQIVAGQYHSLGCTATGQVYAWGLNTSGQTGRATLTTTAAPTLVPGLPPTRQLAATPTHSLALTATGTIYTWGANATGQLALGTFTPTPSPVPTQELTLSADWAQLAGSGKGTFSLARTASGLNFASAGLNSYGQLGDGTTTSWPRFDRLSPLASLQPLPVLAATAGAAFGLAPNPACTQATAVGVPAGTTLAVYDAVGRLVSTSASLTFSVAELPAGVYVVRATAPGQVPQTARLVVE